MLYFSTREVSAFYPLQSFTAPISAQGTASWAQQSPLLAPGMRRSAAHHPPVSQISVFHNLEKQIHAAFRDCLRARFGVESDFALEQPRQASFGEIAVPVAFQLAKSLKQAPKKIAADLVAAVGEIPGVPRWKSRATDISISASIAARMPRACWRGIRPRRPPAAKSSSSTRTSTPTRRRTSGICATPFWAIRLRACCARAATMSKCRTTSTTQACRLPTWSRDFISSKRKLRRTLRADPGGSEDERLSIMSAGISMRALRSITKTIRTLSLARGDSACHRIGHWRTGGTGASGGRFHRQRAPCNHAASEYSVRRAAARK